MSVPVPRLVEIADEVAEVRGVPTQDVYGIISDALAILARHPETAVHERNPDSGADVPTGYFCKCGRPYALCELWRMPRANAVRALHVPLGAECTASGHRPEPHSCPDLVTLCAECGKDYPCPTIDTLDVAQLQVQAPVGEGLENGVSDGEREAYRFWRNHWGADVPPVDDAFQAGWDAAHLAAGYRKAPVVNVEDAARVIAPWLSTTFQDPDDWQMTRARDIATAIKAHLLDGGNRG